MSSIVSGKSRFLKDYYQESLAEEGRWGKQKRKGDKAREIESERKSLWSLVATAIALPFLGPAALPVGTAVGQFMGGMGTWDKGKHIEDIGFMDENVGKFERQQIQDVRDHNRGLEAYDKGEFWDSITSVGTSIASAYSLAGGGGENFDWKTWGSTGGIGGKGLTTGELWKNFFDRPDPDKWTPVTKTTFSA